MLKIRDLIFAIISLMLFDACGHVIHRAGVEPGPNASVMYAPTYHTYYAPPANYWEPKKKSNWAGNDLQVNLGYASQLKNGKRLLFQCMLAGHTGGNDDRFFPIGADIYWQTKTGESNAGVGILACLDPRIYLMWGRDFKVTPIRQGLDFGIGVGFAFSVTPQLIYTVGFGKTQLSLYSEYRLFPVNSEIFCDEDCSDADNLKSRFSLGILFSLHSPPGK